MTSNRRGQRPSYDDSEQAASRPLRLDEVEALLLDGGRVFSGDRDRVVHLLQRVAATLRDHHRRYTELNDAIDRIRAEQADRSHPLTRAAEAIAALSPEEQKQLLDLNYLAALDRLEEERASAERTRLLAVNDVNRVKVVVGMMLADPSTTPEVKTRLEELLAQLNSLRSGS